MASLPDSAKQSPSAFRQVVNAFLLLRGLPFAHILSPERVERVFQRFGNLFGGPVYSTAVMVWSFLGQVLRDGKDASCRSAVARIIVHQQETGGAVPTADTGDYCRARAKLSEEAMHTLSSEVAAELEDHANPEWLWKGRHAKLVDGFTFTMPDTQSNQEAFPQSDSQEPGLGFPIARACAVISLATGCILEAATGPYAGKETGETALLREMLDCLLPGDVLIGDRYYCSYLMVALAQEKGVDVCLRLHQRRSTDFRRGKRLGPNDHLVVWNKPARPNWMDEHKYAKMPDQLVLREIRFDVVESNRRVESLVVVTTLTDADAHTREDIATLYSLRWNSELDIRSVKQSLNLDHLRCKSPKMVRLELWATLLAYNLIRATAAGAALLHDKKPRQLSFTATCQYVLAGWASLTRDDISPEEVQRRCRRMLASIAACEVADRPGRIEPRELKRRQQRYKIMKEPRQVLRARLTRRRPKKPK
jgi:hypothetical protein